MLLTSGKPHTQQVMPSFAAPHLPDGGLQHDVAARPEIRLRYGTRDTTMALGLYWVIPIRCLHVSAIMIANGPDN